MKKFAILMLAYSALLFSSCSKNEDIMFVAEPTDDEAPKQGLSINNSFDFNSDYVSFELRKGQTVKSFGQTTGTFSYQGLEVGHYIIYNMKVKSEGLEVPFKAYTFKETGERRPVKSTSLIRIKKNELLNIYLEK